MQITVLIEPIDNNGFRARSGEPLSLSAEGATSEEALRRLQEAISVRMAAGARLVQITVPGENPWLKGAGMFKDDPVFEQVVAAIAERHRQMDADPDVP